MAEPIGEPASHCPEVRSVVVEMPCRMSASTTKTSSATTAAVATVEHHHVAWYEPGGGDPLGPPVAPHGASPEPRPMAGSTSSSPMARPTGRAYQA